MGLKTLNVDDTNFKDVSIDDLHDIVLFTCKDGHKLHGNSTVPIGPDGKLNMDIPYCQGYYSTCNIQ